MTFPLTPSFKSFFYCGVVHEVKGGRVNNSDCSSCEALVGTLNPYSTGTSTLTSFASQQPSTVTLTLTSSVNHVSLGGLNAVYSNKLCFYSGTIILFVSCNVVQQCPVTRFVVNEVFLYLMSRRCCCIQVECNQVYPDYGTSSKCCGLRRRPHRELQQPALVINIFSVTYQMLRSSGHKELWRPTDTAAAGAVSKYL